jgi:hypothetical protein
VRYRNCRVVLPMRIYLGLRLLTLTLNRDEAHWKRALPKRRGLGPGLRTTLFATGSKLLFKEFGLERFCLPEEEQDD